MKTQLSVLIKAEVYQALIDQLQVGVNPITKQRFGSKSQCLEYFLAKGLGHDQKLDPEYYEQSRNHERVNDIFERQDYHTANDNGKILLEVLLNVLGLLVKQKPDLTAEDLELWLDRDYKYHLDHPGLDITKIVRALAFYDKKNTNPYLANLGKTENGKITYSYNDADILPKLIEAAKTANFLLEQSIKVDYNTVKETEDPSVDPQ